MKQEISIKIGGAAGQGVKTSGYILTKALADLGWWTFSYSEYPSLIRGGHSTFQVDVSDVKLHSVNQMVNILVALNEETINLHHEEILKNGILVTDDETPIKPSVKKSLETKKIQVIKVPFDEIVKKNKGLPVMENSTLAGAVWALLTEEFLPLGKRLEKIFENKKKDAKINAACAKGGFEFVKNNAGSLGTDYTPFLQLKPKKTNNLIVGTGNEVAGLSIYASGCRMYCAYPMTPSTGILHYLAQRTEKTKMVVKQAEDEITAVQMTIGANFAGTRAACGTSGGGLALMTESLALTGITETPLVVFDSQRPGPATGVPTWTEQSDLAFVSRIGHGEFPRILIAPGDLDEVFELVPQAFNLAEKYQTLVIFMLDKYLSESWYQTQRFSAKGGSASGGKDSKIQLNRGQILSEKDLVKQLNYERYKETVSGISPRSLPGMKRGVFLANSDEHDGKGYSTEDLYLRKQMMDKRMRKLSGVKNEIPEPKLYGPKIAKTTVVCWGSQKGPILDAINAVNKDKAKINMLHYSFVYPIKSELLSKLAKKNKLIAVENNYSAQLTRLIRAETGVEIQNKITKYVGTPFFRDELVTILKTKL
jgi:2-oxoglutarate ferredoxin oxidoreductase subunit alpha